MFLLLPPLFFVCALLSLLYRRRSNKTGPLLGSESTKSASVNAKSHPKTKKFSPPQRRQKTPLEKQISADKQLYHQLQNAQDYPEALPVGRQRLIEYLDHSIALTEATADKSSTILSLPSFSYDGLKEFLQAAENATAAKFDAYLARRKAGGPREMFPDRAYAEFWIRQSAPVKYVDGAWLGGVHRVKTQLQDRQWSRTAWQILSEELGDGDLTKNHVSVYENLVNSICNIGRGDSPGFIDPKINPNNDARVWTAAVSQLAISLYPQEFLPEILGFNMAYEALPCHLLISIHELRELELDPYYFLLHIVIDNGDSGHAAMGREAVAGYVAAAPTPEEGQKRWRRVQAGFAMAESLPTTPTPPSRAAIRVLEIFGRKAVTSRPMHACCPALISGKKLSDWLDPNKFDSHKQDFLTAISNSRWISRGSPEKSKLIKELRWGGRMFGAFTSDEVSATETWIRELADMSQLIMPDKAAGAYEAFTGRRLTPVPDVEKITIPPLPSPPISTTYSLAEQFKAPRSAPRIDPRRAASLLIASAAPFERFPAHTVKVASHKGMVAIKCLRALYGFWEETGLVAGMDEVVRDDDAGGVVEIGQKLGGSISQPDNLITTILAYSSKPERYFGILLGIQLALSTDLLLNGDFWADPEDRRRLQNIGDRCVGALTPLVGECDLVDVSRGFMFVRYEIGRCVPDAGEEEEGARKVATGGGLKTASIVSVSA